MCDNTIYISYIIEMGGKIESSRRLVFGFKREHSAILSTFIKLPFVLKIFVCLFLSGCFIQVLLYIPLC